MPGSEVLDGVRYRIVEGINKCIIADIQEPTVR